MGEVQNRKERTFAAYDLTVESTESLSPKVRRIRLRLPPGKEIHFLAGQFMQVLVPLPEGKVRRTAYSNASSPSHRDYIDLCVTRVEGGVSSSYLHGLKVGDGVRAVGPLGLFRYVEEEADAVFIATGSCIAPFRSIIPHQVEKGTSRNFFLIFGNRTEADILYRKEWEEMAARHPNLKVRFTLSRDNWAGPKGYVQDQIEGFVPDPLSKSYYICGLKKMVNAVEQKLLALGVPRDRIRFERYD